MALVENMQKTKITQYVSNSGSSNESQAVSTEEERVMQQAWSEVLGDPEESIGANSILLSLGGDSIWAINVVATCRQLFYCISVPDILSNPTLGEQARHLKPAREKRAAAQVKYEIPRSEMLALTMTKLLRTYILAARDRSSF